MTSVVYLIPAIVLGLMFLTGILIGLPDFWLFILQAGFWVVAGITAVLIASIND